MNITTVNGTVMLQLCNRADKLREVKQPASFTLIEYKEQSLFIEGVVPKDNMVCIVQKNVDFTEGRGPMAFHKVFRDVKSAIDYILLQPGIYGSTQGVSNYAGVSIYGKPYCVSGFNGYDIKIVEIE